MSSSLGRARPATARRRAGGWRSRICWWCSWAWAPGAGRRARARRGRARWIWRRDPVRRARGAAVRADRRAGAGHRRDRARPRGAASDAAAAGRRRRQRQDRGGVRGGGDRGRGRRADVADGADRGAGRATPAHQLAGRRRGSRGLSPLRVPLPLRVPPALRVARFTASMSRAERAETLARCRSGEVGLLVGTQALLESPPELADLRLAIVDEQHRFGVAQRARLRRGGARATACCRTYRGDARPRRGSRARWRSAARTAISDVTFLARAAAGPASRSKRRSSRATQRRSRRPRRASRRPVRAGRQAFVVCPVRASTEREGAITAVARAAELRRALRPAGVRVGLLHGELDAGEKESRLREFAAGDIDVLVATTVIELGIDVPNATVMLVEEADRFGLAQLHQLRGRVGRGAFGGSCLLCTTSAVPPPDSEAARRLARLVATHDGFRIAEADLAQRGHGELFGARQAGAPRWRLGDAGDYVDLLDQARAERDRIESRRPRRSRTDPEHGRACAPRCSRAGPIRSGVRRGGRVESAVDGLRREPRHMPAPTGSRHRAARRHARPAMDLAARRRGRRRPGRHRRRTRRRGSRRRRAWGW